VFRNLLGKQPVYLPSRWSRRTAVLYLVLVGTVLVAGAILVLRLRNNRHALEETLAEAQAALADGDYFEAVDAFSQVLDDDPDNVASLEGQLEAAAHLAQAGQLDAAIAAYETVWQKKPTEARALRGLAQIFETSGDWREAAGWYEKWTQVVPEDKDAFLALGEARFYLGEYEHVVAAYERAEALGTAVAAVNEHMGLAYYELARYDEAGQWLQRLVSQGAGGESPDVFYALGGVYFEREEYERAVSFYERALELDPERTTALAEQARANLDQAYYAVQGILLDLGFSKVVSEGDETNAVAKMGQMVKIEGAVHLVQGPAEGSRALVVEEGTTNWIINPSCEHDMTTGWSFDGGTGATRALYTGDSAYGAVACKLKAPSEGEGLTFWQTISVTAESDYTFSVWAKNTDLNTKPYLWVNTAGEASTIITKNLEGLSQDEWRRYSLTVAIPPGGSLVDFGIGIPTDASQGVLLVDAFQVEQKPYATTYCDGDQGTGYAWSGSPHASTSTRARTFAQYQPYHVNLTAGAIAIWLKLGQFYDWPFVFGSFPAKFDSYLAADGDIRFRIYDDAGEIGTKVEYALEAGEADNWHRVVYVWSQTAVDGFNMWLYVDGALRDQAMNTHWPTNLPIQYARLQPGARRVIARLMIFDRYLSAGEIATLSQAGVFPDR
jgi:tetratricopeptide (TPR) repeat protein